MTVITGRPPKHMYFNKQRYFRKYTGLTSSKAAIHHADVLRRSDFKARVVTYSNKVGPYLDKVRFAVYARATEKRLAYERRMRAKDAKTRAKRRK